MVKINEGTQQQKGLTKVNPTGLHVFTAPSESRAGRVHVTLVQIKTNPKVTDITVAYTELDTPPEYLTMCTCTGYENHKKCWHVEHALYEVKGDGPE